MKELTDSHVMSENAIEEGRYIFMIPWKKF